MPPMLRSSPGARRGQLRNVGSFDSVCKLRLESAVTAATYLLLRFQIIRSISLGAVPTLLWALLLVRLCRVVAKGLQPRLLPRVRPSKFATTPLVTRRMPLLGVGPILTVLRRPLHLFLPCMPREPLMDSGAGIVQTFPPVGPRRAFS